MLLPKHTPRKHTIVMRRALLVVQVSANDSQFLHVENRSKCAECVHYVIDSDPRWNLFKGAARK